LPPATVAEADGRPLYVLLGKDPVAELKRRGERPMEEVAKDDVERKTLALAALAGPVPKEAVHGIRGISGGIRRLRRLFEGADRKVLATTLPALRPEPFADEILLRWLEDRVVPDRNALFDASLAANPEAVEGRLRSLWQRTWLTPEREELRAALQARSDELAPHRVAAIQARAADLVSETVQDHRDEGALRALGDALERLSELARGRPFDRGVRLREAKGPVNAINDYSAAGGGERSRRWRHALADLAGNFLENGEIQELVGRYDVSYIDQRSRGWPYGPPPSM
jgi:hypothetical protein